MARPLEQDGAVYQRPGYEFLVDALPGSERASYAKNPDWRKRLAKQPIRSSGSG